MHVAARQVNVLAWLEGVCGDADAAAALLNSALGPLLVRLLAAAPAPGLRVRLASALGLLVRHTAFIGPELAACGDAQHGTVGVDILRAAGTCSSLNAVTCLACSWRTGAEQALPSCGHPSQAVQNRFSFRATKHLHPLATHPLLGSESCLTCYNCM